AGLKPKKTVSYYKRKYIFKIKKSLKMDVSQCGSSDYRNLSPLMRQTFCNIVNTNLDYLLPHIKQPTLIIWGAKDKETPLYMAKKLNKGIKNSGLVVLDGGHFCYIDKLYEFVSIVLSFVGDIYNVDNN
ncbi:MAG: alpha/beta hydrolase, partial [Clostridia bacterium]